MRTISYQELQIILEKHKRWINGEYDGEKADLSEADLRGADLSGAVLSEANMIKSDLDFSCLPLWCGGLDINIDDRQAKQIAYHLVRNVLYSQNTSKEAKEAVKPLVDFSNGFHRVEECGKIKY